MYAIIKTGGKQYRVKQGDFIDVELLHLEQGAHVNFEEVLMVSDGSSTKIGKPSLIGSSVKGEIVGDSKGPKITSMKYKASHRSYRKFGHRQHYSRVKITAIEA